MPNFKVSSNFIENSSKKGAAGPLWRARRPAGMRKVYERPFSCDICGKRYTQRQGVSRHSQAVHRNSHSCFGCDFKWSRPYQYRIHLERWHPDVDPDRVLGKSAGSRRRSTIIGRDLPQHFPLHVIESDQRSHSEPWQRPTLPLPAAANVTRISQISMLSVAYDPHPEHAEPMATFRKCENAQALEYATDIPAFSFAEECVRSANDRDVSIQRGQLQLAHHFLYPLSFLILIPCFQVAVTPLGRIYSCRPPLEPVTALYPHSSHVLTDIMIAWFSFGPNQAI